MPRTRLASGMGTVRQNAGWPLERLLEELAIRGVTVDARRDKRRAFAGVRLNAVWRLPIAERKLEAMGISKMVRSSP